MCGINGFNWKDEELVRKMNRLLKHRGPDDEGFLVTDRFSIGSVRLAIIDLSKKGRQPMCSEDGLTCIVYNGEIYNFNDIREKLLSQDQSFRSNTDTEVILKAYLQWGPSFVNQLNGMWAFAILDLKKNLLLLSRDRYGIKPLYYHSQGDVFIFSSEIKPILAAGVKPVLRKDIAYDYLVYGIVDHTDHTFFEGIEKLPPGHNLIYDLERKTIKLERYYHIRLESIKRDWEREDDLFKQVRDIFLDSVAIRMIADVPIGSCLSGGIDSSSIVCAMRESSPKSQIKTFSLRFPGYKLDESRYQNIIVNHVKANGHFVSPDLEDFMKEIEDLVFFQEEPFGGPSVYGQYKVFELASRHDVTVLLDGQGADELVAGYQYFLGYYLKGLLREKSLRRFTEEFISAVKLQGFRSVLRELLLALMPITIKKLLVRKGAGFLSKEFYEKFRHRIPSIWRANSLNDALLISLLETSLPALLRYEDKNSMRFSREARVPFLDYRLVGLLVNLPGDLKIRKGIRKYILRKSMEGLVPKEILNRRDKVGFATPEEVWLTSESFIRLFEKILNTQEFRNRGIWNVQKVREIKDKLREGKARGWLLRTAWRIVNFELWAQIYLDRKWISLSNEYMG